MKTLLQYFLFLSISFGATAQQTDKIKITERDYSNPAIEMADKFREDGKIYVVLAVILLILSGMFTYLFLLDKKIKQLEQLNK
jgi:ABC-type amino acid transport system permease subunit